MYVDIAFNASAREYENRLPEVFEAAREGKVLPVVVGLDLESSESGVKTAEQFGTVCFSGIHPLHFFNAETEAPGELGRLGQTGSWLCFRGGDAYLAENPGGCGAPPALLADVLRLHLRDSPRVVGIGECGLDFHRKHNRDEQIAVFKAHLEQAGHSSLPYFFHCRSAFDDFMSCIDAVPSRAIRGVVHSFDGTWEQAQELVRRGFYIGINGCSVRTEENVAVLRSIPLDRILLETDSPYCIIRKSYYGSTFTRILKAKCNEPQHISYIAEAVANIKGISVSEVEETAYRNTIGLFPSIRDCSIQYMKAPQH